MPLRKPLVARFSRIIADRIGLLPCLTGLGALAVPLNPAHAGVALGNAGGITGACMTAGPLLLLTFGILGWLIGRQTRPDRSADRTGTIGETGDTADDKVPYRELVEGSLQGLLIHDDFRPLFVNPRFLKLFGFDSPAEVLALDNILNLVEESGRENAALVHRKIAAGEFPDWTGRLQCRDRDGNTLWVEEAVRAIPWRGHRVVLVTLLDITERVMHEHDREMERTHTERQAEEVVALAEELDAALKLAESQKAQLHRLSVTDPLTGAFNRRHFMEQGTHEVARVARQPGYATSVLIIDIDHFKRINDTHGHAAGDKTLRRFTHICRETVRGNDVFARIGGEEFAVLLPNTTSAQALSMAERLRLRARTIRVPGANGTEFGITVSIGAAAIRDPGVPFDDTLHRADAALYRSKTGGRDRVTLDEADANLQPESTRA